MLLLIIVIIIIIIIKSHATKHGTQRIEVEKLKVMQHEVIQCQKAK